MSKKYYIRNMYWGWFIGGVFLYQAWGEEFKYQNFIFFISLIGVVLFPFSKWVVESFLLQFTPRDFWNRGIFIDTPGKMGGLAIYHGVVFIFSIPIAVLYFFRLLIKMLPTK